MIAASSVPLRSVLFHHIADRDSGFTRRLGVRMDVDVFRRRLSHLVRHYRPVALDDVRAALAGDALPPRALLVTIDDAYASVASTAAPILDELGVPSVFFVNGGFIDHREINIDNLVMYTAHVAGDAAVARAVVRARPGGRPVDPAGVLADLVPTMRLDEVAALRAALHDELDHDPLEAAAAEGLYLSTDQLQSLPTSMTIASHTRSHVRCRMLDAGELDQQIAGNRRLLAEMTGQPIHGFSVPYGSHLDLPPSVESAIAAAGHDVTFLVEGQLNHGPLGAGPLLRVSVAKATPLGGAVELEVLPRLRRLRDAVRGTRR